MRSQLAGVQYSGVHAVIVATTVTFCLIRVKKHHIWAYLLGVVLYIVSTVKNKITGSTRLKYLLRDPTVSNANTYAHLNYPATHTGILEE